VRLFIFSMSTTYSMPIQHMNSWDMWEMVLPLECVILWCCTVIIILPRTFIFSKSLLTKKFWVYYGSVKQTWQECSLYGFRSFWKFNMTLEAIIIDNISIFDDKSLIISPKEEGGILFYLCPSVCPRYFSSHFSQ
jgi:hypothetical protein